MFVFTGDKQKKVIPEYRIYSITLTGNKISIAYDGGEVTYLSDDSPAVAPKIETINITYENETQALSTLREFYKACEKMSGVFCF